MAKLLIAKRAAIAVAAAAYLFGSAYTVGAFWNSVDCDSRKDPGACSEGMFYASIAAAVLWPYFLSAILQEGE